MFFWFQKYKNIYIFIPKNKFLKIENKNYYQT